MKKLKYLMLSMLFLIGNIMASETYVSEAHVSKDSHFMVVETTYESNVNLTLWDMKTKIYKMINRFDFEKEELISSNILFSNDGQYLLASVNGIVHIWNTKTFELVKKIKQHYEVTALRFSKDDKYLFLGGYKHNVFVFDTKNTFKAYAQVSGKKLNLISKKFSEIAFMGGEVLDIAVSSDNQYVTVSFEDKATEIYDMKNGFKKIHTFTNVEEYAQQVEFTNNGQYLIASKENNKMEMYEAKVPFKKLRTIEKKSKEDFYSSGVSKNSKLYITTWGENGEIQVWDIHNDFKQIAVLDGHYEYCTSLEFFDNDNYIVSTGDESGVNIWEVLSGKLVAQIILNDNGKFSFQNKGFKDEE
jgi:WD40 repeat protein